jgi:PAS domain S-box-containing protein
LYSTRFLGYYFTLRNDGASIVGVPKIHNPLSSMTRNDALRSAWESAVSALNTSVRSWRHHWAPRYAFAAFAVAVAAGLVALLPIGHVSPFVSLFPATMLVVVIAGLGPGLLAAVLSAACAAWFIAEPFDPAAIVIFSCAGVVTSVMAGVVQRIKARERVRLDRALRDSQDRFGALVEAVEDYAIFMLDLDGRVLSWNAGAERIKGWSEREITGQHFSVFFPEDAANGGDPLRQLKIAAANGSFHEKAERVRKDGTRFWADVKVTAVYDEAGRLRGYAKVIRDISERMRAARDRADHQFRLTSIIDSAMDAIITVDAAQRIVLFNKAAETMFRCPAAEALNEHLGRFIPQRFRQAHVQHVNDFVATGSTSRSMGRLDTLSALRTNGEEFPIEASISKAQVDGKPLFTVIIRDITQRKRSEERQSLLLLELAHRVKNTLVIVQSIVAQTRRFAAPEEFHDTLNGRLAALGSAHDLLTCSEWAGATLADVVRFGFAPYDNHGDDPGKPQRWTMNGPAIWLASNEAVTLSLVFHELATNAAKYGALSDGDGTVAVRWNLEPEIEPTALIIHWIERGGPPVAVPSRRGFGSRLLRQAVSHELGGETTLEFSPLGVGCRLQFPLSQKVSVQ